jgi:hypothetical protein
MVFPENKLAKSRETNRPLKIIIGLTILLFVAFLVAFLAYLESDKRVTAAYERRLESYYLSDELRQSSDDLTRMVRTYVATGDPIYKAHYQEILDIRNGIKPRPESAFQVYWDLVLADDKRPQGTTPPISLLELMHHTGFTQAEFDKLEQAKRASDELTKTEFASMSLIEATAHLTASTRLQALGMLHDEAYHEAKARIMRPINEFQQVVDQRTRAEIEQASIDRTLILGLFSALGLLLITDVTHQAVEAQQNSLARL